MELENDICVIVRDVLALEQDADSLNSETRLLGAIPEFDSMAVVTVLTMVEDEYDVVIEDDEVSAEIFETVGSLAEFVQSKV